VITPTDEAPKDDTPTVINEVDHGADEPTAYVVPGTDDKSDTYFVDPADTVDPVIVVEEVPGEEPVIIVDGDVVPVIPIGPEESHPVVINVVDPVTDEPTTVIVDNTDPAAPVINVVEDEVVVPVHPVVIPTTDPVPTPEETDNTITPNFNPDTGAVDSTTDEDGVVTPVVPISPIVVPVKTDEEQPSIPTPTEVVIVPGGADEPVVYVVPNEKDPENPTYVVDPADHVDPIIVVVEQPDDEPKVVIDDVVVDVIVIPGESAAPEIVNKKDPETNEPTDTVIIDNTDPVAPVVDVIVQEEDVPVAPVVPVVPVETETIVVPSDKPVPQPTDDNVVDGWTPTTDEEGVIDGVEDMEGNEEPLNPVTPIVIPDADKPRDETPDEVNVIDHGADEPTAYVVPGTDD